VSQPKIEVISLKTNGEISLILQDNTPLKIYCSIPLFRYFLHCGQAVSIRLAYPLSLLWHSHAITPTCRLLIPMEIAFSHSLQSPIQGQTKLITDEKAIKSNALRVPCDIPHASEQHTF